MTARRNVQKTDGGRAVGRAERTPAILRAVALSAQELLRTAPWPQRVRRVLQQLGAATEVSRVYLFENHRASDGSLATSQRFEWARGGVAPQIDNAMLQEISYRKAGFGRWEERLGRGEVIHGLIRGFPTSERPLLAAQGIRSILVAPIHLEDEWWGFIGFDDCETERVWSPEEVDALRAATGIVGASIQRRRAQERLRHNNALMHAVIEGIPDAIFVKDCEGRYLMANSAVAKALGLQEGVVGQEVTGLHSAEAAEEILKQDRSVIDSGGTLTYEETLDMAGGRRTFLTSKTAYRDESGQIAGVIGIARDITEQRRMEEELRRAGEGLEARVRQRTEELVGVNETLRSEVSERKRAEESLARQQEQLARSNADLEQFAYAASHDLQQPLTALIGFLTLHQRRYGDRLDATTDEYVSRALASALHMQALVRSLLDYSRLDSVGARLQKVACATALSRALENLRTEVEANGALVTHDALPEVRGDAILLSQLFQNLIGNAIKFRGPDPPRVHVSAERRDGEWTFGVQDNGIGISPENAEKVFLIFQRCHGRGDLPGTGIGLALCKKIAERHGGRIYVESVPGKGSTFFFTLPAAGNPQQRSM